MRRMVAIGACLSSLAVSGCGTVDTYTTENLARGTRTGVLYYAPKPYLKVSRTGNKDKPIEVEIIYLPDLTNKRYAVMKPGFGSSKLALNFAPNGTLTSTSAETDPKVPELLTALAGLPGAVAGVPGALANAAKTRAETAQLRAEGSDLAAVATALQKVAKDIRQIADDPASRSILNDSQWQTVDRIPARLNELARVLNDPKTTDAAAVLKELKQIQEQLAAIKPAGETGDAAKRFWNRVSTAQAELDDAISKLEPKEEPKPEVTLYEIIMDGGVTRLREVAVEPAHP